MIAMFTKVGLEVSNLGNGLTILDGVESYYNIHKGGFAFPVGSHQADVFPLQKAEGHVLENGPVTEAVGQMLYVQYTHMKKLLCIFVFAVPLPSVKGAFRQV